MINKRRSSAREEVVESLGCLMEERMVRKEVYKNKLLE